MDERTAGFMHGLLLALGLRTSPCKAEATQGEVEEYGEDVEPGDTLTFDRDLLD